MEKEVTREQVIKTACLVTMFVCGFYCGCKYMNLERAFKIFCKKPDVVVTYF